MDGKHLAILNYGACSGLPHILHVNLLHESHSEAQVCNYLNCSFSLLDVQSFCLSIPEIYIGLYIDLTYIERQF